MRSRVAVCLLCRWSKLFNSPEEADKAEAKHLEVVHGVRETEEQEKSS